MLKRLLGVVLVTCLAVPATADLCTIDAVPAATLLLPYFEIDLAKRSKTEETLFSINNASAAPTIAHVAFWTDMSLPTLGFDVFLTGFDVQSISLFDLFFNGQLPEAVDNIFGFTNLSDLQNAHTGREVNGDCYGQRLGGNVARGYVTIDAFDPESDFPFFPNDPDYFSNSFLTNENQLWGEYFTFTKKYIEQERLVSIEAGDFSGPTFYGRYTSSGADQREPLGSVWGARYFSGTTKTYLIVWRDSTVSVEPFDCGNPSSTGAFPLDTTQLVVFDEQEDATEIIDELPFPAETQVVRIGSATLPTFGYSSGWIYLNLNLGTSSQSYVTVRQDLKKRRSRPIAMLFAHAADNGSNGALRPRRRGNR
jgi:hypothetical protein